MPRPRSVSDEEILAATMSAIGRHGPANLTLAHVASEAGVSPAALVQRFGSKARLLTAAAQAGSAHAAESFDRAETASDSPLDALEDALVDFQSGIRDRRELANHLAMLQLDVADPDLRALAAEQGRHVRQRIEALLRAAISARTLARTDPRELAITVHTAYNGALITWALEGHGALADWVRLRVRAVVDPYRQAAGPVTRAAAEGPGRGGPVVPHRHHPPPA